MVSMDKQHQQEEECLRPAKLFIGGITRHTTTKQLRDHFSRYGKVLDCVAMRQPDGRPRGFGYVTLDSPTAADRCLAEPQVIDGRVVDMKRAVPEGSSPTAGTPTRAATQGPELTLPLRNAQTPMYAWPDALCPFFSGAAAHVGSMLHPEHLSALSPPGLGDPVWPWAGAQLPKAHTEVPDCMELLSRRVMPPQLEVAAGRHDGQNLGVLQQPQMQPHVASATVAAAAILSASATVAAAATLSASAPEFVPGVPGDEPQTAVAAQTRTVLGELTNITNVVNNKDKMEPKTIKATPAFAGSENTPVVSPDKKAPMSLALKTVSEEPRSLLEIREDSADEDEGISGELQGIKLDCAQSDGLRGSQAPSNEATSDSDDEQTALAGTTSQVEGGAPGLPAPRQKTEQEQLPSVGSADHAAGTCKRCNFFPKGRCQSGANCSFCHMPHDKRKPSRQEKRERRAAWLTQNDASEDSHKRVSPTEELVHLFGCCRDESVEMDDVAQRTMSYTVLPGMPPIRSMKLPGPLPLPGNHCYKATLSGFPCLPAGSVGLPPRCRGIDTWQPDEEVSPGHTRSPVLATVPMTPMTPQSFASFSTTAQGGAIPREMCTIGTQTLEDLDHLCPRCCDAAEATLQNAEAPADGVESSRHALLQSNKACNGRTWQREEMLQIRGAMEKSGAMAQRGPVNWRTISFSNVDIM